MMPTRPLPILRTLFVLAASAVLTAGMGQVPTDVDSYELPGDGVHPEGVTYHADSATAFVTGAGNGALYRVDLATGDVESVLAPGTRPPFGIIGLATHGDDLWIAGGSTGEILRLDVATGEIEATYATPPAEATFLNDVVVTPNGDAYVTDSNRPVLFRVPAGADEVEAWLELEDTAIPYGEGINLNGIVASEDGGTLIVVHMGSGELFRIDVATGEVGSIDLGGDTVEAGDGLVLDGTTLYVVQNGPDQVTVVELDKTFSSGTVAGVLEDESLTDAGTGALVGDVLLVTNTQFSAMQGEPETPFTVVVVRIQ